MTKIFNCYVERPTKEEAIEIVERAIANGVECFDAVEGMDVTAKGRFYEYDKYEYWGVNVNRGTYTNDMPSSWAGKATNLTMDEYRAKFPCEKYDGKSDEWPKVGDVLPPEQVELWDGNQWRNLDSFNKFKTVSSVTVDFIGTSNIILTVSDGSNTREICKKGGVVKFSCTDTDRERFIEAALATKSAHMWTENEFLGALYDAGFKAPENNNENT